MHGKVFWSFWINHLILGCFSIASWSGWGCEQCCIYKNCSWTAKTTTTKKKQKNKWVWCKSIGMSRAWRSTEFPSFTLKFQYYPCYVMLQIPRSIYIFISCLAKNLLRSWLGYSKLNIFWILNGPVYSSPFLSCCYCVCVLRPFNTFQVISCAVS